MCHGPMAPCPRTGLPCRGHSYGNVAWKPMFRSKPSSHPRWLLEYHHRNLSLGAYLNEIAENARISRINHNRSYNHPAFIRNTPKISIGPKYVASSPTRRPWLRGGVGYERRKGFLGDHAEPCYQYHLGGQWPPGFRSYTELTE